MVDPDGDGILEIIDLHGNGCHRFHILGIGEETFFVCSRKKVRDLVMGCWVHDGRPESFTGIQPQILKVDQNQEST